MHNPNKKILLCTSFVIKDTKQRGRPSFGELAFQLPNLQQYKPNQEQHWGQLTNYKTVHFDTKFLGQQPEVELEIYLWGAVKTK